MSHSKELLDLFDDITINNIVPEVKLMRYTGFYNAATEYSVLYEPSAEIYSQEQIGLDWISRHIIMAPDFRSANTQFKEIILRIENDRSRK